MSDLTQLHLTAIAEHSRGFSDATRGNLGAPVEHCPGWTVADLVWHLTQVHWFWGTIAGERLAEPPDEARRPPRTSDDGLVEAFEAGARRLVEALRSADQADSVWTWAPLQQDVAFITRHQVQEAAVHHWDAVHAAGSALAISAPVAADSVEEFLTFSVSSEADPAEPARPALDGEFALAASDTEDAWTLLDGDIPGTLRFDRGRTDGVPAVTATASDLLLWLYGRVQLGTATVPDDLVARFRALCFTD